MSNLKGNFRCNFWEICMQTLSGVTCDHHYEHEWSSGCKQKWCVWTAEDFADLDPDIKLRLKVEGRAVDKGWGEYLIKSTCEECDG